MCLSRPCLPRSSYSLFLNDTATTDIYTLSLHDALPIWPARHLCRRRRLGAAAAADRRAKDDGHDADRPGQHHVRHPRSEEHTSELQSQSNLVCRLLLEKKKKNNTSSKH